MDFNIFQHQTDGTWALSGTFTGEVSDMTAHLVALSADGHRYTAEYIQDGMTIVLK